MQREWSSLSQIGALALYGSPYLNHPTGPRSKPGANNADKKGLFSLPLRSSSSSKKSDTSGELNDWDQPLPPTLLSYLHWRFIYNFPALNEAPIKFWQLRIQPFFDSFAERNLSSTRERSQITQRRMITLGFTRVLGT